MITEVFKPKSKSESEHIANYHWIHDIEPLLKDKDKYFKDSKNIFDDEEIIEIIYSKFNSFNFFINSKMLDFKTLGILEYLTENIKTKDFEIIDFRSEKKWTKTYFFYYNPNRFCQIRIREENRSYCPIHFDNAITNKSWGYLF